MSGRVVTPEAVLLELPVAGAATRALARAVDLVFNALVISSASSILAMGFTVVGESPVGATAIGAVAGFAYFIAMPVGFEVLWRGRSVGKAIFGLKVVGSDGARETPRQALVRGFVALPEVFLSLGSLAMASAVLSESGQRLGDMAAGTVVIRASTASGARVPIAFHPPAGYEGHVRSLVVAGISDDDFVLIRDFLLRVGDLTKEARWALAADLASVVRARIGASVPVGMHPETWLVCVASAYQQQVGGLLSDAAAGLAPIAPAMPRTGRGGRGHDPASGLRT